MNRAPAFQFYAKDHIATLAALTKEEGGAWAILVCHCWWEGPLTMDHATRLIGEKLLQSISFLLRIRHNKVTFDWMEDARAKQAAVSHVRSVAGELGGRGNRRGRRRKSKSFPIADQPLNKRKPSRVGDGVGKRNTVRGKVPAPATDTAFPFTSPSALKAWTDFQLMRKAKRNPMTKAARSLIIVHLSDMGEADAIKALHKSTRAGYPDVYPPNASIGKIVDQVNKAKSVHGSL